jgi:hypothetical protein
MRVAVSAMTGVKVVRRPLKVERRCWCYMPAFESRGATTNLKPGGQDALFCRNPTHPSRLGSRVVPTVPPLEG